MMGEKYAKKSIMRCNDFCAVYEFYYKYSGLQRGNKR